MLSQIVLITFFLTVSIRNSESVTVYECYCDEVAANTIEHFSNYGAVPIILHKDGNPMNTSNTLLEFLSDNYFNAIVINNSGNQCSATYFVLQTEQTRKMVPALFMMNNGLQVAQNKVTCFSPGYLENIKGAAVSYTPVIPQSKLYEKIEMKMGILKNRHTKGIAQGIEMGHRPVHQTEHQTGNQTGYQTGNQTRSRRKKPVLILQAPDRERQANDQYSTTGKRTSDQIQGNYQATRLPGEVQPYRTYHQTTSDYQTPNNYQAGQSTLPNDPIYPSRRASPVTLNLIDSIGKQTLNLIDSIDKQKGRENDVDGSSQTPSEAYYWDYNYKKPKFGE